MANPFTPHGRNKPGTRLPPELAGADLPEAEREELKRRIEQMHREAAATAGVDVPAVPEPCFYADQCADEGMCADGCAVQKDRLARGVGGTSPGELAATFQRRLRRPARWVDGSADQGPLRGSAEGWSGSFEKPGPDARWLASDGAMVDAPHPVEPGWFLADSAINELQQQSLRDLMEFARIARHTNAVTRKDGVERTFEADWIKRMRRTDGR